MTLNSLLEFAAVKQISLLDIDLIAEFLEPFWERTNAVTTCLRSTACRTS